MIYTGTVLRGDQYGRTLGFPTANLDPAIAAAIETDGVYACTVLLGSRRYHGALYLGPRLVLHETKRVLEIHLIDFEGELYGQTLAFQMGDFIRPPLDFATKAALVAQLQADVAAVRKTGKQ